MPLRSDAAAATLSMQDAVVGIPVVDGLQGSAGPLGEQSRGYGSNDKLVALLDWVLHCSLCAGKNTGGRRNHVEDRTRRPRQGPSSQN